MGSVRALVVVEADPAPDADPCLRAGLPSVQVDAFILRVPRDDGHRFHGMMGTDSTRIWAVIPRDRGQV